MRAEHNPLPENVTIDSLAKGEIPAPGSFIEFFQYLIAGPDTRVWQSDSKKRRIDSLIQDVVFNATSEKKKPRKHL